MDEHVDAESDEPEDLGPVRACSAGARRSERCVGRCIKSHHSCDMWVVWCAHTCVGGCAGQDERQRNEKATRRGSEICSPAAAKCGKFYHLFCLRKYQEGFFVRTGEVRARVPLRVSFGVNMRSTRLCVALRRPTAPRVCVARRSSSARATCARPAVRCSAAPRWRTVWHPRARADGNNKGRLMACLRCPTAFHQGNVRAPARALGVRVRASSLLHAVRAAVGAPRKGQPLPLRGSRAAGTVWSVRMCACAPACVRARAWKSWRTT